MKFYRQNVDSKWYLSELKDTTEYKKLNEDGKYFDVIEPDYRFEGEEQISELFDNKKDLIKYNYALYFEKPSDQKKIESHKEYAIKSGLDDIRSLYICHNCKIIMWHSMVWCFRCPAQIKQCQITNRRLIELYDEGYKIGW